MHMCDELADFGRRAICMPNRTGRKTNGPVRHACQYGSAVVETIYQSIDARAPSGGAAVRVVLEKASRRLVV
jgi:hypothetical protein